MSVTSFRWAVTRTDALTRCINCVSTRETPHVPSSTPNGTGPAKERSRPSSRATSGPCKSHTPLRFPLAPASATTCIMGPNAAAVTYGNAEAIMPSRTRATMRPRTERNMERLRHTNRPLNGVSAGGRWVCWLICRRALQTAPEQVDHQLGGLVDVGIPGADPRGNGLARADKGDGHHVEIGVRLGMPGAGPQQP